MLFRAEASGGGENARLKLTLRVWRPGRFELRAHDALGRGVWSLAVVDELGLWTDRREDWICRFEATNGVRVGTVDLPLPSRELPSVLLGSLPVELPEVAEAGSEVATRTIEFEEADGRHWRVRRDEAGAPVSWELTDAGGQRLLWRRDGDRARLRSLRPEFEIEWREVARGPLDLPEPDLGEDERAWTECGDGAVP